MKKTLILLLIFALLGGGVYWFTQKEKGPITTVKTGDRDFAVKDVDQIGKIFIADRTGIQNTIERKGDHWIYNDTYRVRKDAIDNLLVTIRSLEVKFIPPNGGIPVIVKTLATHGIKVEVYDRQDEILKTYYVGGMTNDERATYMIMEDAEQPYAMHIPSMDGGLRVRYRLDGDDWRDRSVFRDKPEDIQSVTIKYPKQKNKSFVLSRKGKGFEVTPFYDITPKINRKFRKGFDEKFIKDFKGLIAEGFINEKAERQSFSSMVPFAIVTVVNTKGEETSARFHPDQPKGEDGSPLSGEELNSSKSVQRYNVEHSSGDLMLVQQLLFGKIFWSYDSFFET